VTCQVALEWVSAERGDRQVVGGLGDVKCGQDTQEFRDMRCPHPLLRPVTVEPLQALVLEADDHNTDCIA
jgi:hypothetical protein